MLKVSVASMLTLAAVLFSACGSATPTVPTTFAVTGASPSFAVTPSSLFAQAVTGASCPTVPPFTVPFNLSVTDNSGVAVFVTEIRLRFTDSFGVPMPQVTLPAPTLTREFGTMLIQARGARTFPMSFTLGCLTAPTGIVFISIDTQTEGGLLQTGQVSVSVR